MNNIDYDDEKFARLCAVKALDNILKDYSPKSRTVKIGTNTISKEALLRDLYFSMRKNMSECEDDDVKFYDEFGQY